MKEQLKDRIDVLFERAKAGDNKAQLQLAKYFQSGHLVERSIEQAQYWSFKAISSGNSYALSFYRDNNKSTKEKVSDHAELFFLLIFILPYVEMALSLLIIIIGALFDFEDSIVYTFATNFIIIGFISMVASFISGSIAKLFNKKTGSSIGNAIGVVIIHIIGILYLLNH